MGFPVSNQGGNLYWGKWLMTPKLDLNNIQSPGSLTSLFSISINSFERNDYNNLVHS